jgi:predicted ATPase/class 3 adenylate cyclase
LTGTVTFLLTDIEKSTHLWERDPKSMRKSMALHDALVADVVTRAGGQIVKERGEGDSHFVVFQNPSDALKAAADLQRSLSRGPEDNERPLSVRIVVHTGEVQVRGGDYYGLAVNKAARIRSVAHGGQVLVSLATRELAYSELPRSLTLVDLGEHRLRDLMRPEQLFQLAGEGLRSDFPPLRSLWGERNNLPLQLTNFVGREEELVSLRAKLSERRLLTLLGPGGCGKTRLALQCAAEAIDDHEDGVWFVDLVPASDVASVWRAVADALHITDTASKSMHDAVTEAIQQKRMLLVLDNCEHLGKSPAVVAEAILTGAPFLHILATSRRSLGLAAEAQHYVRPLTLPEKDGRGDLDSLLRYDAVQLILDRAASKAPNFRLTEENADAVAALAIALEGMPLAIELAAPRLKVLSPDQLLKRFHNSLDLLKNTSGDGDGRHRSLRAVIDWSYNQLSPPEKLLLHKMTVLPAGCTLETAEAICCGEDLPREDILDLIESLVDNSLLHVEGSDEPRYRMLETIRQYCREEIGTSSLEETHERLFLWASELASRTKPLLLGNEQDQWMKKLSQEYDNIRLALEWACNQDGIDNMALSLACNLDRFWQRKGIVSEGRVWLERALNCKGCVDLKDKATVLRSLGMFAWSQDHLDFAAKTLTESLQLFLECEDLLGAAGALANLGVISAHQGENSAARSYFLQSLDLYKELGEQTISSSVLQNLAKLELADGNEAEASRLYQQALAGLRRQGDKWVTAMTLSNMAELARRAQDYAKSAELIGEALQTWRELQTPQTIALAICEISQLAFCNEHFEFAARLLGCATHLWEEVGYILTGEQKAVTEQLRRELNEVLPSSALKAALAMGEGMTADEMAEYALSGIQLFSPVA